MAGTARTTPRAPLLLLAAAVLVPLAGLALLSAAPDLDGHWEHRPTHFWLVLGAAAVSAAVAVGIGGAARQRGDPRVVLASSAFLVAAGFLGLHALATPGVLLDGPNAGFVLATLVGLFLASILAAASALELSPEQATTVRRRARMLPWLVGLVLALWAVVSLAELPPLRDAEVPERASGVLIIPALLAVLLFALAVVRHVQLFARRRVALLLALAMAYVLLAQASIAVAVSRNWHASWWQWHVLMLAAFAIVAVTAHRQWHEERFAGLYLDDTLTGEREVSVLFADLAGFTTFSEQHEPREVSEMLNRYFAVAIPPVVTRYGGTLDRIIGDALMVVFNERNDTPDHARRAAAAALALQEETAAIAREHPAWPRFRAGVNTGRATATVLGTAGGRTFTVIGDAVNLASRLEALAPVGGVAVGPETAAQLGNASFRSLGVTTVKGRVEPVEVFELLELGPDGS